MRVFARTDTYIYIATSVNNIIILTSYVFTENIATFICVYKYVMFLLVCYLKIRNNTEKTELLFSKQIATDVTIDITYDG